MTTMSSAIDRTVACVSQSLGWSMLRTIASCIAADKIAVALLQTQKLREDAREEKHQLAKDKRLTWQQKVRCLCQAKFVLAAPRRNSLWGTCGSSVCRAAPCLCCQTAFTCER